MKIPTSRPLKPGHSWRFARYITNRKTGQRIYPKNGKAFCFQVKDDANQLSFAV